MNNPFPRPTPLELVYLTELGMVAADLERRGWNCAGSGNFSLRGQGSLMWQSRSGVPKDSLDPSSFVPIDFTTCAQISPLQIKPSDETPIHAAIYKLIPKVRCVVHAHPVNVLNFVKRQTTLVLANEEMIKAWSLESDTGTTAVPMVDNTQNMAGLAKELPYLLKPSVPVLVVRDHGVYAWGESPKRALNHLEACEYLCRTQALRNRS